MSQFQTHGGSQLLNPIAHSPPARSVAYVIEVGETQAGLVSRAPDERHFTFISASAAFDALDGRRFATPSAAELAARRLGLARRPGATRLAA
jgi:hypothetical protein